MRIVLRDNAIYDSCTEQGISRDELSRRMGVATSTAYRVEKRDVEPSSKFVAALMHVTGKPFEELFEIVAEVAA